MSKKQKRKQQNNRVEEFQTAFTKEQFNGPSRRQRARGKGKNKKSGKNSWAKRLPNRVVNSPSHNPLLDAVEPVFERLEPIKTPTEAPKPQ